MAVAPRIAINGKFLSAAPTGVHRVAAELATALAELSAERPGLLDVELWVPRNGLARADAIGLPIRLLRPLVGIPWEQIRLPFHQRRRLLLNLCNIGPVARANAMTMIHDAQVHLTPESYGRPFRMWYKFVQPLLGRRNRRILTVSEFSRRAIADAGLCPVDRISVIHNGADHMLKAAAEPDAIPRLGLAGGRFVVALATVQAHKNIAVLMRAFAAPDLADLSLVLVGSDGPDAFVRHGIAVPPNAVFAGRVSDGTLRALYEAALCLAFPSRTEGFGLPPLEAMLVGCPVIIAPCGALPETCRDAAVEADPERPELWVERIRAIADDPAWRRDLIEAGRRHARLFTWRAAAIRLLEILGVTGVEAAPADAAQPERRVAAS